MRRLLERVHALPFRVATKFAVTFTVGALAALALVVTALALHERSAVTRAATADLEAQGDALAPLLADVLARVGEPRALEILRAANLANANVTLRFEMSSPPERSAARVSTAERTVVVVPVDAAGIASGHVLVLEKATPSIASACVEAFKAFLLAGIPLGLFAMLSAYTLGEWLIGAPLRRVAERAQRIGEGDLEHSLDVRGSVEIAALKRSINAMLEDLRAAQTKARDEEARRIAAVNSLRHADRLRTVGTLAAGIAHELGTPLNVILLESRSVERAATNATRVEEGGRLIRAQAIRMTAIIRQLLEFARRKSPARTLEDAVEVVAKSASLVASLARARSCTLEVEAGDGPVPFYIDQAGVQQILTNLFVNAFDAMPSGGRVRVRVTRVCARCPREQNERPWVCVEVEDDGTGMDEVTRTHVFEPFFTTKDVGSGTGLGLSVALGIVEDHGGFMDVRARSPNGSVFTVCLPADDGSALDETGRDVGSLRTAESGSLAVDA